MRPACGAWAVADRVRLRARLLVLDDDIDAFNDDFALGTQDLRDRAFFALVFAGDHAHGITDAKPDLPVNCASLRRGPFFFGGVYIT